MVVALTAVEAVVTTGDDGKSVSRLYGGGPSVSSMPKTPQLPVSFLTGGFGPDCVASATMGATFDTEAGVRDELLGTA